MSNNNNEVSIIEEFGVNRVRRHLKREIVRLGIKLPRQIPAKYLLLPELEGEWLKHLPRWHITTGKHLTKGELILALTILHPPIHQMLLQMGLSELLQEGKGIRDLAVKVVNEWKEQGRPKPGPVKIGKTLIVIETRLAPFCLRTERCQDEVQYLVTKIRKTQEIRWGSLKPLVGYQNYIKKGN